MNAESFLEARGRGIKIGVIDDGICQASAGLDRLAGGVRITFDVAKGIVSDANHAAGDPGSHGTLCARIIAERVPDADLFSIKIFEPKEPGHPLALAAAFKWAIDHELNVLNVSLGTTDDDHLEELRAQCRAAAQKGIIIVAATNRLGLVSYPSSFADVLSVGRDDRYHGYEYGYYPTRKAEFVASGQTTFPADLQRSSAYTANGTSIAAARMTANVAALLQILPHLDLAELKNELAARQTKLKPRLLLRPSKREPEQDEPLPLWKPFGSIGRAAIYPLDRNIEPILACRDLFPFAIDSVVDPFHPSMPGKDAGELYGHPPMGIPVVKQFDEVGSKTEWLIIGDLRVWEGTEWQDSIYPALQWAVGNKKHVLSLGPADLRPYRHLREEALRKQLSFLSARELMEHSFLNHSTPPSTVDIDVPVIGVFGTAYHQGKFATQLALLRGLRQAGFVTGFVGTNPASVLIEGGIYVPQDPRCGCCANAHDQVAYWEMAVSQAFRQRPHVLMFGTQGFIAPFDLYSPRYRENHNLPRDYSLPALAALMGGKPDASILVVNSMDSFEHIKRCIAVIESLSQEPVIAIAVANKLVDKPYGYSQSWARTLTLTELSELKQQYLRSLGLPVYCPFLSEDRQALAKFVIDSFEVQNAEPAVQAPKEI